MEFKGEQGKNRIKDFSSLLYRLIRLHPHTNVILSDETWSTYLGAVYKLCGALRQRHTRVLMIHAEYFACMLACSELLYGFQNDIFLNFYTVQLDGLCRKIQISGWRYEKSCLMSWVWCFAWKIIKERIKQNEKGFHLKFTIYISPKKLSMCLQVT